jgi:hypothetical protein
MGFLLWVVFALDSLFRTEEIFLSKAFIYFSFSSKKFLFLLTLLNIFHYIIDYQCVNNFYLLQIFHSAIHTFESIKFLKVVENLLTE